MTNMLRIVFVVAGCLAAGWAGQARAQMGYHDYQHIHVNGLHLDEEQIEELEYALGYEVPSGFYWVDFEQGVWGYEGNEEVLGSIFRPDDPRRQLTGRQQPQQGGGSARGQRPAISNDTGTGSAVINPNPGGCSYATVGGTTMRFCD